MAAGAIALATLLAQEIPAAIALYKQIAAAHAEAQLPPVETILAKADAQWDAVATAAAAELAKLKPTPPQV